MNVLAKTGHIFDIENQKMSATQQISAETSMPFPNLLFHPTRAISRKICSYILLLCLLLPVVAAVIIPQSDVMAAGKRKQVLFINSYHPGYKWSDDITNALAAKFQKEGNVDLRIEYLDTKRQDNQAYMDAVENLFETKYRNNQPDLIMSSDDAALNFLFKYANTLFPNVPVVFAGANYFDESRRKGFERFTGISEEADVKGTLDLALQFHPEVKKVVVINDKTVTGQKVREKVTQLSAQYPQIQFDFAQDLTMDQLRQQLGTLGPDALVLLTVFFRDSADTFYEYDQFTSIVAQNSPVPVYGLWDFSLGYGIVGGKLTSGHTEGERAADVAIRILRGEDPTRIPVERQTKSQYMFDYTVLKKWGISVSRLPDNSTVINRPVSFYEQNMLLIWAVAVGFIMLVFIIIFLSINNNQRRKAQTELSLRNRELQAIQDSLERTVAHRTKDLATVAEVSTTTATILDTQRLLQAVVDLSKERFGLYHAHIYLLDEAGENLILAAGAGEAGRIMAAEKRSIPLSKEQSLVARAARERKGVTVNDVTQAPDFLPNPLLSQTRSELAVPMLVGEKVVGVFDIQSEQIGRFTDADINIQTTLAAQLATSVQNVRSFEQSKKHAELESRVNAIGQKIQRTTSIEETLQTAIRELGTVIGAVRVKAQISRPNGES